MIEIEFHQLELPYSDLRIAQPKKEARLMASLATEGQHTPVVVVERSDERYVLIDGYVRARSLRRLARDTVRAVVLAMSEAEALIWCHRQESAGRRSAVEEAWLLHTLTECHGLSQTEVAVRLGHTQSWVSRRLGLLSALPESVHHLIRTGRLPAQAAMKYLVPMARAMASDCARIAKKLAGHRVSVRQMKRLYIAWRSSDRKGRDRIVEEPLLFLEADAEMRVPEPPNPDDAVVKDIRVIGAICDRVHHKLEKRRSDLALPETLQRSWPVTRTRFEALKGAMEERLHARQ